MSSFALLSLAGWLATVVTALLVRRTRAFAVFVGVFIGIYSLVACAIASQVPATPPYLLTVFAAFHVTVFVNFFSLARPRMRPLVFRLLVSWPAAFFSGGTLFALPWAVAIALGFHPWGVWIPYALAAVGLVQSLTSRKDTVDLVLAQPGEAPVQNVVPHPRGSLREERPLRIVQVSDPHLGPFMSVRRFRKIAERAVAANPDLVFLTGDFLTMESHHDETLLLRSLEPLKALRGRVFACFGNHDYEAPEHVKGALRENGITLLMDEEAVVETGAGPVQILGAEFVWRNRDVHLRAICEKYPRRPGTTRIVLLHDPGAFKHLPEGEADLVLSGHTHGGQIGLVSLGLEWTFIRLFGKKMPDHGYWARGKDRLYVHRGTGHYGFPLRLGVPAEESLLRVHRFAGDAAE